MAGGQYFSEIFFGQQQLLVNDLSIELKMSVDSLIEGILFIAQCFYRIQS